MIVAYRTKHRPKRIKCANCSGIFYELNENYDPNKVLNATMLTMMEPYKSYGWEQYPPDDSIVMDQLACPDCGAPIVDRDGKAVIWDGRG